MLNKAGNLFYHTCSIFVTSVYRTLTLSFKIQGGQIMNKLIQKIAEYASAATIGVVGTIGTTYVTNTSNGEDKNYCEVELPKAPEGIGATADEVFEYALGFEGWTHKDFADNGYSPNNGPWCAWFTSTMLLQRNIQFPVTDFNLRIWVADILAGYIGEERYIHTSYNTKGFVSEGGGVNVTSDMLEKCKDINYSPSRGDLVFFDWQGDGLPDHIGIVNYIDNNGVVHTLEGNPGYINGVYGDYDYTETMVSKVPRNKGCIIGYAKPEYYEKNDAIPTTTEVKNENENNKEKKTITFYDDMSFAPIEKREYIVGEPLGDLPIIDLDDSPSLKLLHKKHKGWSKKQFNKELINEEFIMPNEDIKLYAVYDDFDVVTTTKAEESTTVVTTEEATNLVVVEEVTTNNEMFHHTENKPIQVESLSLNRYSKTLNTVGNSTSFTLKAEAYPTNAVNKSIYYESSNSDIARVDSKTGCIYAVSDGTCSISAIANNGVSASCEITVSTQYTTLTENTPIKKTETVVDSYEMECYVGRTVEGKIRQFFSYDISSQYDELGLSRAYGMWHHVHTFPASQVDSAPRIYNGMHQGGSQDGANACKDVGYSLLYGQGDEYYIFFIKNINYKTVERVSYQTNTTRIPVEYA